MQFAGKLAGLANHYHTAIKFECERQRKQKAACVNAGYDVRLHGTGQGGKGRHGLADDCPILEDRADVIERYAFLWEAGSLRNMRVRVKAHAVPFSPNDGHEGLARYSLTVAPLP